MKEIEKLQFIKENYLKMPIKTIGKHIGHSQTYVRKRMRDNNWVVPREIIEERKRKSQFKKGLIPHNKGKKLEEYMPIENIQKIKQTQFKKGQKPHNTKEGTGHISIRKDSSGLEYKYIKLEDSKWELLHRYKWKAAGRELKENEVITFKDGNTLNCKLDNLEKITRAEHAHRNSYNRVSEWTKPMAKRAILTQIRKNNEI